MSNNPYQTNTEGINFLSFLDTINANLKITRHSNQDNRCSAVIEYGEIKEGPMLIGKYGNGESPEEAIEDYLKQIKGETLVLNAMSDNRREYVIPKNLYFLQPNIRTEKSDTNHMYSSKYRLMIYFAHSTMVIYSKTISSHENMTPHEFMMENEDVIKRVSDEAKSIMEYELSYDQISRASLVYLKSKHSPSSVYQMNVYNPQK